MQLKEPEKVKDHPVFKELVRYRTLLERVRYAYTWWWKCMSPMD